MFIIRTQGCPPFKIDLSQSIRLTNLKSLFPSVELDLRLVQIVKKSFFLSCLSMCRFCNNPSQFALCSTCFTTAFQTVKDHYLTDDINQLITLSQSGPKGHALTFCYSCFTREEDRDISDGQFIIDDFDNIAKICKYDHLPLFSHTWIDLAIGEISEFWRQARSYQTSV